MIEAGANEVPNDVMLKAIAAGHEEIKKMVAFIADIQKEIGKPKFEFNSMEVPTDMFDAIYDFAADRVKVALDTNDKNVRDERLQPIEMCIRDSLSDAPEKRGQNGKQGLFYWGADRAFAVGDRQGALRGTGGTSRPASG